MKKVLLMVVSLLLMVGCETGVENKAQAKVNTTEVSSGIIDYGVNKNASAIYSKGSSNKIFSKSAQPGFYLQYAVFQKYRPNKAFLKPLNNSSYSFIVLNKSNKDYVLIGPYKSHNEAQKHEASVKKYLHKQTFVVQVLRP